MGSQTKLTTNKYFGVVVTELIKRKFGKVCHIYIEIIDKDTSGNT